MPQSLANILLHVIFSTKNRAPWIPVAIEAELHPYLASICRAHHCPSHEIGGAEDHIHIVCSLARTVTVSSLLEETGKKRSRKSSAIFWRDIRSNLTSDTCGIEPPSRPFGATAVTHPPHPGRRCACPGLSHLAPSGPRTSHPFGAETSSPLWDGALSTVFDAASYRQASGPVTSAD
jgi:REP element-mobilizing transposase RayT